MLYQIIITTKGFIVLYNLKIYFYSWNSNDKIFLFKPLFSNPYDYFNERQTRKTSRQIIDQNIDIPYVRTHTIGY